MSAGRRRAGTQARRLVAFAVVAAVALAASYLWFLKPFLDSRRRATGAHGARLYHDADLLAPIRHAVAQMVSFGPSLGAVVLVILAALAALSVGGHLVGRRLRHGRAESAERDERGQPRALRGRRPVTGELILGRADRAAPYEVSKLFDGFAGQLRPRWYERFVLGSDSIALTLVNDPAARTFRFLITVRADTLGSIESRLRATYPDIRIRRLGGTVGDELDRATGAAPESCLATRVLRLKKARRGLWSLQTTRDYEHSVVEGLATTMAGSSSPCAAQLVLTPVPLWLEQRTSRRLRSHEQNLNAETAAAPTEPGVSSAVEQRLIRGAVENVGRSLFFFDYRILTPWDGRALGRQITGVVQEARADNDLRRREMRIRRTLYVDRFRRGIPPLLPAARTGLLSAAELATLWHLPTMRLKGVGLQRARSRQIAASPAISRSRTDTLMFDEVGPVGIRPADRRFGWAVLGGQGVGKTAALLRHIGNVARDHDRALVVIDPKVDLARESLAVIPPDRTVHYIDLAKPYVGFNPLTALRAREVSADVVADIVVSAIRETAAGGPGAVGDRSDQFLRTAIAAVCTVEDAPTLAHVHRMLDPDDGGYRGWVVRELSYHPEARFLLDFWGRSFQARLSVNPRFVAEILEAPRNKLSRFLAVASLAYLTGHPVQVDLAGILDRREVLVLSGNKGAVGEDNAVLVCQLMVLEIQKLLHQQQELDRADRVPLELVIDEGHNVFKPSLATTLSEGRSAGINVTIAFQYTAQIQDETVKAGIKSLLQNISIFRLREFEDARAAAALAMEVYADAMRADVDDLRRLRIDPIDIINQPLHRAVNLWVAEGTPEPAFTATTLPIEPAIAHADGRRSAAHHRAAQRQRGNHAHDHDLYSPEQLIWSVDAPAVAIGREVFVDLTTWPQRPDGAGGLAIVLNDRSRTLAFRARSADGSGRRISASTEMPSDAIRLADGEYRVGVVDGTRRLSWQPVMQVQVSKNEWVDRPVSVGITTPAVRPRAKPHVGS
jgi:hypothetical protein